MTIARCALAVTAAAAVLVGCGSSPWQGSQLDEQGWYACQDFADEMTRAGGAAMSYQLQPAQRAEFTRVVSETARGSSTPLIQDAADVMARTVNGSQPAWQLAIDTFAQRCLDRGFKAT